MVVDRSADGIRYSIIDFKVTERAKSVETLLESYQSQLELYVWALECLEPESRGNTDALLINISARTVQTVPVPMEQIATRALHLSESASRIVQGEEGKPKTGPLCKVCEFRVRCPEGQSYVAQFGAKFEG